MSDNDIGTMRAAPPAPGGGPAKWLLGALIAAKIMLLFYFAWHSRFVMDEFVQLGWAKYLGHGMFDTIWHPKAVGYVLFFKLAHLIGWDARSILLVGRMETAVLACGTLAIIYGCGRALGNDRMRSMAIVLVLLCFSNFIERSFRTIAEPLAVFFAAAALLVILRGEVDRARTLIFAGILAGLSFLATQKALYFDLALGLALVGDAALSRRWSSAVTRGLWLTLGWVLPIIFYCVLFGGADPLPIAHNLFFGPLDIASHGANAYGSLRGYVRQTLQLNIFLYLLCFGGMIVDLLRLGTLAPQRRIALIFTTIVTLLVFSHNQPWPYVFIMALPFIALWSPVLIDRVAANRQRLRLATIALGLALLFSLAINAQFADIDNRDQLDLVDRAEALLGPDDVYFDGVAMLPNHAEPGTLWLDRALVLETLDQKQQSKVYRTLAGKPPKLILWTYRMTAIEPVVGPLIDRSYVAVAPNIRLAGRLLEPGRWQSFDVPVAGRYALYDALGHPLSGTIEINGRASPSPVTLSRGTVHITLRGDRAALLLPHGTYAGWIAPGRDNPDLFERVYD